MNNKIIAEVRTTNYAWGKVDNGVIVTQNGSVYKYDISKYNNNADLTKEQRFELSINIGQIDNKMLDQIVSLSTKFYGQNANLTQQMFDAGSVSYSIYDNNNNNKEWTIAVWGNNGGIVKGAEELVELLNKIKNGEFNEQHSQHYDTESFNSNNVNEKNTNYYIIYIILACCIVLCFLIN